MRIDKPNSRVYVRQSWLNDMAICPERARYGLTRPEFRTSTDATIIGTSLHTGIESVLGDGVNYDGMLEVVREQYDVLASQPHQSTNIDAESIPTYLESMSKSFYDSILPTVKVGGKIEHKFQAPLGVVVNDMAVWLEGTMDYVDPDGIIWDWKTSSRAYNIKDKQKSSIQASVYASAATALQLSPQYPVDFRYGVMVRNLKPKAQVVSLVRTEAHNEWLKRFVLGALNTALTVGVDNNWFMNDSSNLCSSSWCSYWSICKGAFVSDSDNELPDQLEV
jgi:hypothetical protein